MEQQYITSSKKFFIVLIVAVAALLVGSAGLIVSLQKPEQSTGSTSAKPVDGNSSDLNKLPDGASGPVNSTEIKPNNGNTGVVESPQKH